MLGPNAAALEVEELVGLQAADRGAVGALHVIGHDLELGLGVDPRPVREQQVAAQLGRVGPLGFTGNPHRTVEDAPALAGRHGLVHLIELPFRARELHEAVGVSDLLPPDQLQAPQGGVGLAVHLHQARFMAGQSPARCDVAQGRLTLRLLLNRNVAEEGGIAVAQGHQAMAQLGAAGQMGFDHHADQPRPLGLNQLGEVQLGLLLQHQEDAQREHPAGAGTDQFQGSRRAAFDPQGEQLCGAGVVQLHRPVLLAAGGRQGVAQPLGHLGSAQGLQPLRQGHASEGIAGPIQLEPQA